jgi:hypothetical protein
MKPDEVEHDEMREEYAFSKSLRAPYAAMAGEVHLITLEPDVVAAFPDSASVNEALRLLIRTSERARELAKAS